MKRYLLIIALAAFTILVGSGCKNIKSLEADFGGLDIEYYPALPSQEQPSIFDWGQNKDLVDPANWSGPKLMPMSKK